MDGDGGCEYETLTKHVTHMVVIPAKAGIHLRLGTRAKWIPAFAGMTASRDARMSYKTKTHQ
ncbi:hypothetical protein GCM10007901_17320 [Dyella acidisoli]|uniref:Uncharacterized protein n=1 Tax=Dyella acidisoli TaxID=1867834 RepID=A0ABQ5XQE0_9GAMM|nr:hypothetical protein GCM10007901_17320 [Dyella acidisoli]